MKTLTLFLVFGLLSFSMMAQESNREVYPQQSSINHNGAVKRFSSDFASSNPAHPSLNNAWSAAADVSKLAVIDIAGSENITVLSQQGYHLTGFIDVQGDQNRTNLHQNGTDLLSILKIQGHANQVDMTQQGSNLQNHLQISGSGLNFDARQTPSGFELIHSGSGSIPFSLRQTGRSVPIIITNH